MPSVIPAVFKQALRASGANVTDKHIELVSLCALFLMEAAKRADSDIYVPSPSTSHTIRDSASDINKIRTYVHEKEVNREVAQHTPRHSLIQQIVVLRTCASQHGLKGF